MADVNQYKKTIKKLVDQRDELQEKLTAAEAVAVGLQRMVADDRALISEQAELIARGESLVVKLNEERREVEGKVGAVIAAAEERLKAAQELYAKAADDSDVKKLRRRLQERGAELDAMTAIAKTTVRRIHAVVKAAHARGITIEELKTAVDGADKAKEDPPSAPVPVEEKKIDHGMTNLTADELAGL